MNYLSKRASDLQQGAIRSMFDKAATMDNVISMGIGEPDMATPEPICQAAFEALKSGKTHYTTNAGAIECRRAIAEHNTIASLHYDPEREIVATPGGMGALSLFLSVVVNAGDEVLIQDPQWLNYVGQVEYVDGTAVRVPTRAEKGFALEADEIEKRITPKTKLLMLNSPNNPTGCVVPLPMLEAIADVVKRHDLLVVSDEVYNTLYYGERPVSISELPGMKERTVVINSMSKAFAMTGWRLGYAAGPEIIIDKMVKAQENMTSCANSGAQFAAAYAYEHPEFTAGLRDIFSKRRSLILSLLDRIDGITYSVPTGAFYVFPYIGAFGLSSAEFCNRLLDEQHVVCIPGSAFGACGEGDMRMAYTCSEDNIVEAIRRISEFCATLRRDA